MRTRHTKLDRRRFVELAGAAGFTGLAGCIGNQDGSNQNGGDKTTQQPNDDDGGSGSGSNTLTVWAWNDQALAPIRKKQASTFKKEKGIPLKWQYFPWSNYLTKLQSSMAAGNAPESFALATVWIPQLGSQGAIGKLAKSEFPEMISAARRNSSYQGNLYAVPWYADCRALAINVDKFEEAGLTVPEDKTAVPTWDQFAKWVNALSTGDQKGYVMAPDEGFEGMFLGNGGNYLQQMDGGKYRATMSNDEVVRTAQYFLEDLNLEKNVLLNDDDIEQFIAGNAAMSYAGSWELQQLDEADVNYAYLPQPSGPMGETSHTWSAGVYYSVPSSPTERQRKWMSFVMSKKQQLKVIDSVGGFPGRKDVYDSSEFQQIVKENPTMEVIAQEMQKAVPFPRIPGMLEALGVFRPAIEKVWQGQASPETAFKQADKKVAEKLSSVAKA